MGNAQWTIQSVSESAPTFPVLMATPTPTSTLLEPSFEGDFTFADQPFELYSGGLLQPITLHYTIYGHLNERHDNAILVCHALSGSARAGDWWPQLFLTPDNPDGVFDLDRDCVVCVNILGSCYGSTGPQSLNPATGQPYGKEFP